jgi:drug/metabolite transporter (DMT)-like permease
MNNSDQSGIFTPAGKPIWFLYAVILFHQVITAVAFPMAKLGLNEIEPFTYAFLRFTLSSLIFIPILFFLRKKKRIPFRDHTRIFLIGIILIPFNQVIFLVGQSMTTAGHSSLLFAMIPIFIYILAIIYLGEKATLRRTLGILVAIAGVYIILSGGSVEIGGDYLLGDLLILVAVVAWAVATVMAKPLLLKYGAFRVTGLALVYGSLLYFPYGLYRFSNFRFEEISSAAWISLAYLAFVVSILAYVLWYWVLKYMEASRVAVVQNIQPVIASAVAVIILNETIGQNFIIGGIIIITGVVLTELK